MTDPESPKSFCDESGPGTNRFVTAGNNARHKNDPLYLRCLSFGPLPGEQVTAKSLNVQAGFHGAKTTTCRTCSFVAPGQQLAATKWWLPAKAAEAKGGTEALSGKDLAAQHGFVTASQ